SVSRLLSTHLSSTAAIAGGTAVLDGLRRAARSILGATHPDDRLWLLTADAVPRPGNPEQLAAQLSELAPSELRLDLGQAIALARQAMAAQPLRATVVVLSDLQCSTVTATT